MNPSSSMWRKVVDCAVIVVASVPFLMQVRLVRAEIPENRTIVIYNSKDHVVDANGVAESKV